MAKQTGPIKIIGTVGNICFYEMDGGFFARLKSSLTGKRVKRDPRFKNTMAYAAMLAAASKLASCCYQSLPKEERVYAMFRALTGMAMGMLKAGMDAEEIAMHLDGVYRKVEEAPAAGVVVAMQEEVVEEEVKVSLKKNRKVAPVKVFKTTTQPEKNPSIPTAAFHPGLYVDHTGKLILKYSDLTCLPPPF